MIRPLLALVLVVGLTAPSYALSETKQISSPSSAVRCINTRDKSGKYIRTCKTIKVHRKLDGRPVPQKK